MQDRAGRLWKELFGFSSSNYCSTAITQATEFLKEDATYSQTIGGVAWRPNFPLASPSVLPFMLGPCFYVPVAQASD